MESNSIISCADRSFIRQMHTNVALTVAYDGTDFFGFQENGPRPTIEKALYKALRTVFSHPVKLQAASRTDCGVHAEGQVVNFFLPHPFPLHALQRALNSHLPKEIRILTVEEKPTSFHPSLMAKSKTYTYLIDNAPFPSPFHSRTAWHVRAPLNLIDMHKAANYFLGEHDFTAFATRGHHKETRRILHMLKIEQQNHLITFTIQGKSFLYRMARAIVGTLVEVGRGNINPELLPTILQTGNRALAGPTAPPHGLTLSCIDY